jgi:hypothetical protein
LPGTFLDQPLAVGASKGRADLVSALLQARDAAYLPHAALSHARNIALVKVAPCSNVPPPPTIFIKLFKRNIFKNTNF